MTSRSSPMPESSSLTRPQRRVLDDALRLVRDQRRRAEADDDAHLAPSDAWATPFGLGYVLGAVDGLCQVHGAPFDGTALAIFGLVLDDTFGRPASDALRQRGVRLLQAGDADLERGRSWGGNEAIGLARARMEPVGLVHLARGDEDRMGPPDV